MSSVSLPRGVEVCRGERVESRHRVRVVVADAGGAVVAGGVDDGLVFPRSAVKPIQALALIETGAADAFGVAPEDVALACASHNGETAHVERAAAWLARLGLGADVLACGPHPPLYRPAADDLVRAGSRPTRAHNNCSGKHAGMLTTALHLNEPIAGYADPGHPVQHRCRAALAAMSGEALDAPPGIDGCSLPNWPLTLQGLATAGARLVDTGGLPHERARAAALVTEAMRAHPFLVAGTKRLDTELMAAEPELIVKTGAEGVYLAADRRSGRGLALKATDGATRAAEVALLAALDGLGWLGPGAKVVLAERMAPRLVNFAGVEVGRIVAAC